MNELSLKNNCTVITSIRRFNLDGIFGNFGEVIEK